LYYSNVAALL